MSEPIISVSGLRGIVGQSLTPEVAVRYVAAYAATLPPGRLLIARDGRPSGAMLAGAVHAGLHAAGRETLDGGILPTPTVGVLMREVGAVGAVQITASHNPPEYNGLKLFAEAGRVIPAAPGEEVLRRYRAGEFPWAPHNQLGSRRECVDVLAPHFEKVISTVDNTAIRARGFRVLLDSNHGSGSVLGRRLLEELGCRVTVLGDVQDGRFAHPAEPTEENLREVCAKVREVGADIGFCQDPDADRLAIIDADGHYLGEEYTVAICINHVLGQQPGPVVINCATSQMTDDIARRHGVPCHRSAVGEANVVDGMLQHGATFGGEGNGGPIDPRVGLVRDSFVGMAQVLDAMTTREMSVAQLADELPSYAIVKKKAELPPDQVPAALDKLEAHFADARADRLDGLRLDWSDRWLLVRPSNTEPIVRLIAEAPDRAAAEELCSQATEVI